MFVIETFLFAAIDSVTPRSISCCTMVCDAFEPNPFKPAFCKVCQRPKAEHHFEEKDLKGRKEACDNFTPNPFKPDLCKTCQQGKKEHVVPDLDQKKNIKKEPIINVESVCDNFEPNPFKPNLCKGCRLAQSLHKNQPQASSSLPQPTKQAVPAQPAPKAAPALQKDSPSKPAVEKKLAPPTEKPLSQPKQVVEVEPPRKTEETRVNASGEPTECGVPCTCFEPNPFKPTLCKVCRLPKAIHALESAPLQPAAPVKTAAAPVKVTAAPAPATTSHAASKPRVPDPLKQAESSDDEEPAKPAPKVVEAKPAVAAKVPPPKRAPSSSDDEEPAKPAPKVVEAKPETKRANRFGDSDDETDTPPKTKPVVGGDRKIAKPANHFGDSDEEGEGKSVKATPPQVEGKQAPKAATKLREGSVEEVSKPATRAPPKVIMPKVAPKRATHHSSDDEDLPQRPAASSLKKVMLPGLGAPQEEDNAAKKASVAKASTSKYSQPDGDDSSDEEVIGMRGAGAQKKAPAPSVKKSFDPAASRDHHERFRQGAKTFDVDDEEDLSAPAVKKTVKVSDNLFK